MRLAQGFWIEGAYYLDFDELGQLRIVGPGNQLNFGSVGLASDQWSIDSIYNQDGQLVLAGHFPVNRLFLHDPAIGHTRRVRDLTEHKGRARRSFAEIYRRYPTDLAPNYIALNLEDGQYQATYRRLYGASWYGTKWLFGAGVEVKRHRHRRGYDLSSLTDRIDFKLTTDSSSLPVVDLGQVLQSKPWPTAKFGTKKSSVDRLLDQTAIEINHLVKYHKTSGFDYGTVFPRDWMEAADLGTGDFTTQAASYMYHEAYRFIDQAGQGWHENMVGELEFTREQEALSLKHSLDELVDRSNQISRSIKVMVEQVRRLYINRNMIDIEPRYLFALDSLGADAIDGADLDRLRRVAQRILQQADANRLITFKKLPALLKHNKYDEYFVGGNWRDSEEAYKKIHPVIAPYDVNVVFYPRALEIIEVHSKLLKVDAKPVATLRRKWSDVAEHYRLESSDGGGFALALYDVRDQSGSKLRYQQLKVHHTDEAYALFYAQPEPADVLWFAKRLLDPAYFYTKSGPAIIGAHDGYTNKQYHGRVIWTKQTAYVAAGLARQLGRAKRSKWPPADRKLIEQALAKTAETSISAWLKLGQVPELHYDQAGRPHLYNDQPEAEGVMNLVQLWSAVGARRIIRTYLEGQK